MPFLSLIRVYSSFVRTGCMEWDFGPLLLLFRAVTAICEPGLAQCCNVNVVTRQFGRYESSSSVRTARVVCIHQGSYILSSSFDVSRFC